MQDTTIYIGADYHGFKKKEKLKSYLTNFHDISIKVKDMGTADEKQDDYNDPAISVSKAIKSDPGSYGILLCGSAHGVCIQSNRFKGIRAINAYSEESAKLGREHDDANVICLSAELLSIEEMKKILYTFFHTEFKGEERRIRRIKKLDKENYD